MHLMYTTQEIGNELAASWDSRSTLILCDVTVYAADRKETSLALHSTAWCVHALTPPLIVDVGSSAE